MNDNNSASTLSIRDKEHLQLLAIFHILLGVGMLFCIAFGVWSYHTITTIFSQMADIKQHNSPNGPSAIPTANSMATRATTLVLVIGILMAAQMLLSAIFMLQNRCRTFSLILAALVSLFAPLGTILGVLTIIVLTRDSVREAYRC